MTVRSHFRAQASACARLGSPFTARLLDAVVDSLDEGGVVGRTILHWRGDRARDQLHAAEVGATVTVKRSPGSGVVVRARD